MQRVKVEPRDEGPSVNVITHSGMATRGSAEKVEVEPLIHKEATKQEGLDLHKENETFVATRQDFAKAVASNPQAPTNLKADAEVKTFLQACMKLLHNQRAIENLQVLIDSCVERTNPPMEVKDVHKLYKHKKHIGREVQLTTRIGDYEMEQVILDLGSYLNVFPKKT